MARLSPIEISYFLPSFPDDLFNWYIKNKLDPSLFPTLEKVKIGGLRMKKKSLDTLQSWLD
jgi:hypothetical protein